MKSVTKMRYFDQWHTFFLCSWFFFFFLLFLVRACTCVYVYLRKVVQAYVDGSKRSKDSGVDIH